MADNHVAEDISAGEGGGFSPVEAAAAEGAGDSVDQMDPADVTNGNALDAFHNELNDKKTAEDGGREDMFVDCPDEIENSESQQNSEEKDNPQEDQSNELDSGIKVQQLVDEMELLRDMHDNSVAEKERFAREYEEERSVLMRELAQLHYQLKVSNEQQSSQTENADGSCASLHEMISECSRLVKNVLDERIQSEEKVRELHSVLHMKDQEIDFLHAKDAELSESNNIAQSDLSAKHENLSQLYEVQLEKDQHIEEVVNRILASVSMIHHQEELVDGSLTEKISNIEKSVAKLVEKYNIYISESDQLRGCLNEVGLDINMIVESATFVMARDKILELKRKEESLYQNLSNFEDENRKLVEELEKQRSNAENVNAEIRRLSAEVEQEKNRYANTKEKLSMAVTKGKALVQQRDSLKQLLAEKTSQLEKCSIELQEKSTALEAAEKTKELIAESEKFAVLLQESLAEKDMIIQKCGEILSESVATEEPQPMDITEKLRWLVDENKSLKTLSLQYHKLTDALLLVDFPETVASSEPDVRVRWLAESYYMSKEEVAKLQSEIAITKEAVSAEIEHLTISLLAETQEGSYLQAELEELRNKCEAHERLQHELAEAREAVNNEIDRLTTSLLAESQEKSYLQLELENLRHKHEEAVQKEYLLSLEKDKIVSMLLDASGLTNDAQEEVHLGHSDTAAIIDNCFAKINENTRDFGPSQVDAEFFESFQSLLYIRDQEMNLYKLIVEGDILDGVQVSRLSDELEVKSQELDALQNEKVIMSDELGTKTQELSALKNEKAVMSDELETKNQELNALKNEKAVMSDELEAKTQELNTIQNEKVVMQDSLQQLEDRCALLKEKLSMAVKKGKGLVQDRENLKGALNEKSTEIDRLKSELEQTSSRYTECQDQINKLSLDVERISLLETDLVAAKERADQLEQFLAESNSMLQRVMEAIDSITTPTDLSFEEPVKKVKWVAGYLSEKEVAKLEVEKELREVKDEASSLASKLSDVQTMMQSLEDALSVAENSRSQLLDEKKELEVSKALLEEELRNEKEKYSSHTSKFEELSLSRREIEDALLLAQENISRIMNERDIAQESSALAEEQLQKLKEEFSNHITKLADADKTIQSLEDALSEAQKNISLLAEENSTVQIGRADLDSEIKQIREEADSHASKLADASVRINYLEDALLNAENNMAELVPEKKNAEQEILALTSKLESCMEELAGIRGSIENRSLELSAQLSRFQLLLKDETLSSLIGQCFRRKIESLHDMSSLLKEMTDCFQEMDSNMLQNSPVMEDDSSISTTLPSTPDVAMNIEMLDGEVNAVDSESIIVHIEKLNERFHLKGKILANKFDNLSTHVDESIAALLRRLHITKDRILSIIKYTKSLKQQMQDMEIDKQRQDGTIVSLESDIRTLLSACADATQRLDSNVHKSMSELRSIHELAKLDGRTSLDMGAVEDDVAAALATDHVKTAERLLLVTRQNQDLSELFQDAIKKLMSITEHKQSKLKETQLTCDEALKERDWYKDKISKLETDLKEQQNLCHGMTSELDDYKEELDKLREREAELSTSLSKIHELEDSVLSAAQVKSILDRMNEIEVPDSVFAVEDSHVSANVRKLFYVIDSFSGSLQNVSSLSRENEELQSTIDKQSLEIDYLKKHIEDHMDNEKDSENMSKLLELELGLQNIVRKLGGSDLLDDLKVDWAIGPLPLLDKLVTAAMLESESLKSKNEELGAKLLGTQKIVDELSNKVKLLEDSNRARTLLPEIDQERGTSMASLSTQLEISEIQDTAPLGKINNIPHVSSAAHARTLRKGSSDHLAINIDSESERLINNKESDEDKGHVFKSLNTSGVIPRQGRNAADRIDGIWVSGSRALMSRPRGRLGLIAYWLVLHIWLLGTVVL